MRFIHVHSFTLSFLKERVLPLGSTLYPRACPVSLYLFFPSCLECFSRSFHMPPMSSEGLRGPALCSGSTPRDAISGFPLRPSELVSVGSALPLPQLLLPFPRLCLSFCIQHLPEATSLPAPGLRPLSWASVPGHSFSGPTKSASPRQNHPPHPTALPACSLCDFPVSMHSIAHVTHLLSFHVGQISVPIILLHLCSLHPCCHCPSSRMGP